MRRRDFIHGAVLVAGTAAASFGNALREGLQARLTVDVSRTISAIPPDFVGLRYENGATGN